MTTNWLEGFTDNPGEIDEHLDALRAPSDQAHATA